MVHRSEVLANLTAGVKILFRIIENRELAAILHSEPRGLRPARVGQKHLSGAEIDHLVQDYKSGIGSIYDLADSYGVHRTTIAKHLKIQGVRMRNIPLDVSEVKRARQLRDEGLSLNAIGRKLGRDPKTVKHAII